jgi:hypothetical protein
MTYDQYDYLEIGDNVIWPNGVAGQVLGTDDDDATILDECGGWHDYTDVELPEVYPATA